MTTDIDQLAETLYALRKAPEHEFIAALDTLVSHLKEAEAEIEKQRTWLDLVAKAQHQLLDAVKLEMTDAEWAEFAAALGIDAALSTPPNQNDDELPGMWEHADLMGGEADSTPPPLFPGDRAMLRKLPAPPNQEAE